MAENLVICIGRDINKHFSCLISDVTPDLGLLGQTQCFPLYVYDVVPAQIIDVNISDENLATWRENGCFVAKVKAGFCEEGDMLRDANSGRIFTVFKADLLGDYQVIGVTAWQKEQAA